MANKRHPAAQNSGGEFSEENRINQLTRRIIGCAMQVYNTLGNGFQEVIYQRALAVELTANGICYEREKEMPICYRDQEIGTRRVDFFVELSIMVETKALHALDERDLAQAINYLEAYHIADGLLFNFGGRSLEFKRLYNKNMLR